MGEPKQAAVDDLIRAIRGTNPFQSNRVSSPNEVRVDVGQLHGRAFRRLTDRIEQVRPGKSATGVLLIGGPGTGKSHLLGRLSRWAGDHSAAFVFLHNLQASPERMPRYVLKATISAVFRFQNGVYGNAGLLALLLHALDRREGALTEPTGTNPVDPEIAAVLDAFMKLAGDLDRPGLAEAAVDWLSGDEIDEEQARALGDVAGRRISTRLADAAAVERVLIVLARLLALDGKVLVLCLDQIDNLDLKQIGALLAFLHALIDHAENLVAICAGVDASINHLRSRQIILQAAWDRIGEYVIELEEVTSEHARSLIAARTKDFLQPFAALDALEAPKGRDSLFPLGEAWFRDTFGERLQVRPRDVVTWARDQWERVQEDIEANPGGGARWLAAWPDGSGPIAEGPSKRTVPRPVEDLVDEVVRAKVEECRAQRMLNSGSLPPDTDNLARLTANLLSKCVEHPEYSLVAVDPVKAPPRGPSPAFEFIISERNGKGHLARTGVACLPGGHAVSTARSLHKILDDKQPLDHVLVVTDQRRPFKLGAKGQQYYDELQRRGPARFRHNPLSLGQVVELDALDSVLGMARVGDLEIEYPPGVPRPVSEPEAVEAMHRLQLLVGHPFLHELLTEDEIPVAGEIGPDPLDDRMVRDCIADFLSWRFGANATEVMEKLLEDHPDADRAALLRQVIRVTDMMHIEGHLQSTPIDQDRYLLWTGGGS